ncbi:MAG: PepSY domain-containing protein [Deltaproteobacteria bacterium]|nr:PepSY domain-containing protein [Deltaproteobacteria bacterium]
MGAVQGHILKTELENENGILVYGVEVVTANRAIVDVKVDAGSGKVLALNREEPNEEEHHFAEYKQDLNREE